MVSPAGPFVEADPEEHVMNRQTTGVFRIFHLHSLFSCTSFCTQALTLNYYLIGNLFIFISNRPLKEQRFEFD